MLKPKTDWAVPPNAPEGTIPNGGAYKYSIDDVVKCGMTPGQVEDVHTAFQSACERKVEAVHSQEEGSTEKANIAATMEA